MLRAPLTAASNARLRASSCRPSRVTRSSRTAGNSRVLLLASKKPKTRPLARRAARLVIQVRRPPRIRRGPDGARVLPRRVELLHGRPHRATCGTAGAKEPARPVPPARDARFRRLAPLRRRRGGRAALREKPPSASRQVIVVTGGMWIIGYKAWGALLAMTLMRKGFIVASLDYRNFPQGTVGDMAADVGAGFGWVRRRAARLGGDPKKVFVVGRAGRHLAALALLRRTRWQRSEYSNGYGAASSSSVARAVRSRRGRVVLETLRRVRRGLRRVLAGRPVARRALRPERLVPRGVLRHHGAGFSGSRAFEALPRSSPCAIVREFESKSRASWRRPCRRRSCAARRTRPRRRAGRPSSRRALRRCGEAGAREVLPGKTHTDPFVTDPILGGGTP